MILDKIKQKQKEARLAKDKFRASVLTTLMAEVQIVGKNSQRETTNDEALVVIGKFLKNLKESFRVYSNGIELEHWIYSPLETNEAKVQRLSLMIQEANIYKEFLPKQMTKEELEREIGIFLGSTPNANMGVVMQHFGKNHKGTYDGKVLSVLIKAIL